MAFILAAFIVAGVVYLTVTRSDQVRRDSGLQPALAEETG
jgi:hypothetical protein